MANARVINNYSFLNEEGAMVDLMKKKRGERIYLHGRIEDFLAWFMGNDEWSTSSIIEITEEGEIITKHSVYKLGNISPDYQEFLDVSANGILTIGNWNIFGSKERGYYLTADIFPQRKSVEAKILSQNGNFLTIQRLVEIPVGGKAWEKPEQCWVCWSNMSAPAKKGIKRMGRVADIEYVNFEYFDNQICRPVLEI